MCPTGLAQEPGMRKAYVCCGGKGQEAGLPGGAVTDCDSVTPDSGDQGCPCPGLLRNASCPRPCASQCMLLREAVDKLYWLNSGPGAW